MPYLFKKEINDLILSFTKKKKKKFSFNTDFNGYYKSNYCSHEGPVLECKL